MSIEELQAKYDDLSKRHTALLEHIRNVDAALGTFIEFEIEKAAKPGPAHISLCCYEREQAFMQALRKLRGRP